MDEQPGTQGPELSEWLATPEGQRFLFLHGEGLLCVICYAELTIPQEIEQRVCRDCWPLALDAERKAEIAARDGHCACGKELLADLEREHGICQVCVIAYAQAHPLPDGPGAVTDEEFPF